MNISLIKLKLFIDRLNRIEPGLVEIIQFIVFNINTKKKKEVFQKFKYNIFSFRNFKVMYYNYKVITKILENKIINKYLLDKDKLFSSIINFLSKNDVIMFISANIINDKLKKKHKFILIDIILKDKRKDYKLLINPILRYAWFEEDRIFEPMLTQDQIIDRDDLQKLFLDKYIYKKTNLFNNYYIENNLKYSSKIVFGESIIEDWSNYLL